MRRGFPRRAGRRAERLALLNNANQMMQAGDYKGAAAAFDQLAAAAERRSGRRAPMFLLQAGRSRVLSGGVAEGLPLLKRGLGLLSARGRWLGFQRAGQRIASELQGRGLAAESNEIEALPAQSLPVGTPIPAAGTRHPVLPTHCPACGAVVHPDEIEWLDGMTGECDYCGSPLRAQG